jgi:hypothetical protein
MHLERMSGLLEAVVDAGRSFAVAEVRKMAGLPKRNWYWLNQFAYSDKLWGRPADNSKFVIGNV